MYTAGTISGTKGSNKITGKSTQWLSNLYNILEGQVIIIYTPTSSNAYSIKSIKSNTEIELSKPLYDTFTNATYEIFTTLDNTTSDAAVKIATSIARNNDFMTAMNQWTTGTGTVTVNWGNEQIKLTTVDQMNKNIAAKFDKTGGDIDGPVTVKASGLTIAGANDYSGVNLKRPSSGYVRIEANPVNAAYALNIVNRGADGGNISTISIPNKTGALMQVGDFGMGGEKETKMGKDYRNCFISYSTATDAISDGFTANGAGLQSVYAANRRAQLFMEQTRGRFYSRFSNVAGADVKTVWNEHYTTANTTKDSNGNLKAASPVVKIYADDIVVNEESDGVELKKLHTGIYQLKGTLGMNSDPSWGGIHGGIVVPNGINGLQLVYADYDVLAVGQPHPFNGEIVPANENGDIVVYTTYRKHSDLPQNIQRARLKTYPEFTKEVDGEIVELSAGELVDIPNGHWLDVRVQMPSNSVYNIRQAEQEELARIAAEKAEAEEIERLEREAIEEAERIEREETERLEREEADRLTEEAERESYESNNGDQEL